MLQCAPPSSISGSPCRRRRNRLLPTDKRQWPTLSRRMGRVESDHVEPPFCVTMMEATLLPLSPTATQVAELAVALGAQETALTLARGAKLAVVCHCGATAAAGSAELAPNDADE